MEEEKNEERRDPAQEVQLVAFILENEEFAVNIHKVREVIKLPQITPLPRTVDFIEGVINLRGDIIPVIDLCKRFGLERPEERDEQSRIIIVEAEIEGSGEVGLIVDAVTEVIRMDKDLIQPPPTNVSGARADLIQGVGRLDERLIIMLNLQEILSSDEQIALEELTLSDKNTQLS